MHRGRRPADTGPERNQAGNRGNGLDFAAKRIIANRAIDAALLRVVDVLAEIARETDVTLGREQSVGEVKHED